MNTPGLFWRKREVQNLGRLKNVINLPLSCLINNIFTDISPEDSGNQLKDKITPSELCALQSLCVHLLLMSHICLILLSAARHRHPNPAEPKHPNLAEDLESFPGLKWCQCLKASRESASYSLCMMHLLQRCLMLWKCKQALVI